MTTKNPVYSCKLVYKLAQKWARDNAMQLSKDECEAMELVGRRIHVLERLVKKY